jgi:hypothetical protein
VDTENDFSDVAVALCQEGKTLEAIDVCLAGLCNTPSVIRGRLVLARAFFERGYVPFAVRELEQLRREVPENDSVRRLLEKLSPKRSENVPAGGDESTVAEAEFDIDLMVDDGKE